MTKQHEKDEKFGMEYARSRNYIRRTKLIDLKEAFLAGIAHERKEMADGDICPACGTEFEKGTFTRCGGDIIKRSQALTERCEKLEAIIREELDSQKEHRRDAAEDGMNNNHLWSAYDGGVCAIESILEAIKAVDEN